MKQLLSLFLVLTLLITACQNTGDAMQITNPGGGASGQGSCFDTDEDGYLGLTKICKTGTDCNDDNPNINPGVNEMRNQIDDNCNGQVDEGLDVFVGGSILSMNFDDGLFDDSPLDNFFDIIPSGNVILVNDAERGSVASFDGNSYLDIGARDINSSEMSISTWVKFNSLDSSGTRIISKATSSSEVDHLWMLGEYQNKWRARLNGRTLGPQGSFNLNEWYHVAMIYDSSSWKIYVNAEVVNEGTNSGAVQTDASVPVLVGANPGGYGLLNGYLDDLNVYDRALSLQEIADQAGVVLPTCADSELVGTACDAGQGICQASGTYYCEDPSSYNEPVCNAVLGTPTEEICGDGIDQDCNGRDLYCGPTGEFRVIQDHPNLLYNDDEIAELRQMILVDRSPSHLVSAYNGVRSKTAYPLSQEYYDCTTPTCKQTVGNAWTRDNLAAAFSYMIEPTSSKASAIRNTILNIKSRMPFYMRRDPVETGFFQLVLPFMYDLTVENAVWSDAERDEVDEWFSNYAGAISTKNYSSYASQYWNYVDEEGSNRLIYSNHLAWDTATGLLAAYVGNDDQKVQDMLDGNWPATEFTFPEDYEIYTTPITNVRNARSFVYGSVYPSGATWDGYRRGYGFDPLTEPYVGQESGQGQSYHFFVLQPLMLAAEAALHNTEDLWSINDHGLVRALEFGEDWATTAFRAGGGNPPANIVLDYSAYYWYAHRHYPNNAVVNNMLADNGYPNFANVPFAYMSLFGYPVSDLGAAKVSAVENKEVSSKISIS